MAKKPGPHKGDNRDQRSAAQAALADLGGAFQHLIDLSVRNDWSTTELLEQLKTSKRFQRMFPGLVQADGTINPWLGNNLSQAVGNYRQWAAAYQKSAAGLYNLNRKQVGFFIENGVSPDEFGTRINAITTVRNNPGLMDMYNQELTAAGKKPLDEVGFLKFTAGVSDREFYDLYEASYLRSRGLNLDATQALGVAQGIGTPGQPADLEGILADVYRFKNDIQPELDRQGIGDADLALLAAGSDARNITPILQGLIANKRARGAQVPGYQSRRGSGGGVSYLPEDSPENF